MTSETVITEERFASQKEKGTIFSLLSIKDIKNLNQGGKNGLVPVAANNCFKSQYWFM